VPWVRRAPSAYIREHVRFSLQPLDLPPDPTVLLQILDQLGSDDLLLYASDYPHRHAFDPERDLLTHLSEPLAMKIRRDNARDLYRLP
jgi:predicted TIM-barrel fold metal-dependent hydrolase